MSNIKVRVGQQNAVKVVSSFSSQGIQGSQGTQGVGDQGTQGSQGIGNQGLQGALSNFQGTQGVQGLQGTQGLQGSQGTQGLQGALSNFQGTQGVQGLQGVQGAQSAQGPQGVQGSLSNFQGTQGTQGAMSIDIVNDISTDQLFYPQLSEVTSGSLTTSRVSSERLVYNPFLGSLGIGTNILTNALTVVGTATATKYYGDGSDLSNIREEKIIYVSKDGNDSNEGSLTQPKLTIKGAVADSIANTVIRVAPGVYEEDNPIILPDSVTVMGHSLRETEVKPLNPNEDLFHIGNANYIAEMSYRGVLNGKAIFAFDPNKKRYINQSPYVQNCTNFIPNSIGMRIDGKNAIGPLRSMVLDSYTQYNQGGIGISITNEAYAQLVSLFTICDDIAVFCGSGGACDLTNSNSSFGNYGLIADGVGPLKYVGVATESASSGSDTFVVNLNNPSFNISTAYYDNSTGILTAYTTSAHKFSVGMGVTLSGLKFTCQGVGGINTYPSGAFGYIFDVETVAPGRYVDSYNLIQSNKQEIQDKSLASIAINHPDFVFPGDPSANARFRFYDSYRLIQNNKQEIIDKSLASIAVGFPSGFAFPDDPLPYKQNRFYDASGLIQRNKQEIIDKSLGAVAFAHSDFYFPGDNQTNSRSRYFDSYRLIQKNKDVIVSIAWTNTQNAYNNISANEQKCKRDLGFFVDAISTDVLTGGNNYARQFALQYFNSAGSPITNGLLGEETESNYSFSQARDLMKQAVTNTLSGAVYTDLTITPGPASYNGGGPVFANNDSFACADVRSNIDNLVGIVTTVIGSGNTSSLPNANFGYFSQVGVGTTSSPGGFKCARDLGFLVEAIATDVFTGGNKYSRDFTLQYFDNAGNPISSGLVGEVQQSITAFNALRDFSKKAVTNQLNTKNLGISSGPATYGGPGIAITVYPSGNPDSCTDVQSTINTLVGIVTTVIGAGNTSYLSSFSVNLGISTTNICARDLGYLVDAISTDVFTGGNKYSRDFTNFYFNGTNSVGIGSSEREQSVYAFNSLRDYSKKAITNQLNSKDVGISSGPATYGGPGIAITVYPSGNPDSCTDVQANINTLVGIVTTVIGSGSQSYLNTFSENSGSFPSGSNKCYRDIGYLIDAVSLDVRDYTNQNCRKFIKGYFDATGNALSNGIKGEVAESKTAFNAVRDYSKKAITNQLNYQDLTVVADPVTGSNTDPLSCSNVRTFIDNLVATVNSNSVGIGTSILNLPAVSIASTVFTCNVGVSTTPNQVYVGGGTAQINVIRPFDGQVVYVGDLYYTVSDIIVSSGGTGYTSNATITIDSPSIGWGIPATAVAEVKSGSVVGVEMISNGRGYTSPPKITVSSPNVGINTAIVTALMTPSYYSIFKSTPVSSSGICTITLVDNLPYSVGLGTNIYFYKQSRVLASGHSLEYIGSGIDISKALPFAGGVPIQENETDSRNGGLVVYTSTDQSGNFRIGDGVTINQQTGTISGRFYSKSLFSTITPFILALGGD
jgi:hypothetical protein